MLFGALLLLAGTASAASSWSFQTFLDGDWDLERVRGGTLTRARYSLQSVAGGKLEGTYFEYEDGRSADDPSAHSNLLHVRVDFLDGEGRSGSFNVAKAPAGDDEAAELQPVFDFEFGQRHAGAMWLSESKWLGARSGLLQFAVVGADAFILTSATAEAAAKAQEAPSVKLTSWTATRISGSRAPAATGVGKRSLLQRWGWYLGAAIVFLGYRVSKAKQA